LAVSATGAELPIHIRNFGKVDDHVYRGGVPSPEGLKELANMHVVLDIDLREPGQRTAFEKNAVEKLGITYLNVPLPEMSAPPQESVRKVLIQLTAKTTGPVFVHCRRGKDRTGTIIACYRVEQDHWSNRRALDEANHYGMSFAERAMRRFVLNFKSLPL
jgi:protein tyrosine/serine phosphatase